MKRVTLLLGLTLVVSAGAAGTDKPIPQDTARMAERRRERLEWHRRTLQGAYDKVGKRDPRWDAPARKALEQAAWMYGEQVDPEITSDDVRQTAKIAVDAGCDDPMVLYLYSRGIVDQAPPGDEAAARKIVESARALAASRYPAVRRAIAHGIAGRTVLAAKAAGDAQRKEAEHQFDAALSLLPESVKNEERNFFWEERWLPVLKEATQGYRALGVAPVAAYERVDAALAKMPEVKVMRLKLRGDFWYSYGWEARTNALAVNVPAGGFETLEKRVSQAQKAFTEAWRLHPDDAVIAGYFVMMETTVGGDRATMELWFDRAMKADGDARSVCATKLQWLDPKWHGSVEEMLAFGEACRATKNWWAGITLLAADAHFHKAARLGGAEMVKYLNTPEVWTEIKLVYDEYLSHRPHADVERSKYATLCYLGRHYLEAQAQFDVLGDRLTVWPASPNYPLSYLKEIRDKVAKIVASRPRGDGPTGDWITFNARNDEGRWSARFPVVIQRRQEAGILGIEARNVFTCTAGGITYTIRIQLVPAEAKAGAQRAASNT